MRCQTVLSLSSASWKFPPKHYIATTFTIITSCNSVQPHYIYLTAEMIMKVKTEMININTENKVFRPLTWRPVRQSDHLGFECAQYSKLYLYKFTVTTQGHMTGGNTTCLDTAQSIETKGQALTGTGTWRAAMHGRPANANNVTLRRTITEFYKLEKTRQRPLKLDLWTAIKSYLTLVKTEIASCA